MADDQPIITDKKPVGVDLEEGTDYYWCTCGHSKSQLFCDGSHEVTSLKPLKFNADKAGKAYLCLCKHSKNPPYCDGSHKNLP